MKSKTPLIILILVVAAVLAFALNRPPAGDPYESFALAMDSLVGSGQWSAQSHETGAEGLAVQGLTLNPPPSLTGAPAGRPAPLTIDSVIIKNLLPKARLEKILAAADWRGQAEAALTDGLKLKGLRHATTLDDIEYEASFGEVYLGGVRLAAAAAEAPAGRPGFLKALRLADLSYKNFKLAVKSAEAEASAAVAEMAAAGVSFSGAMPAELAALDPSGFAAVAGGLNLKSLKADGLNFEFSGQDEEKPFKLSLALASLEENEVKAFQSLGFFRLAGLKASFSSDKEPLATTTFNLAELKFKGLDFSDYLNRFMPALVAAIKEDGDQAQEALAEALATAQNLRDFFVSPISMDDASLSGLEFNFLGPLVAVKLDKYDVPGPYRAGEIPPSWKAELKGLEISLLPEAVPDAESPSKDISEFVKKIGRNRFVIDSSANGVYEAKTGSYTINLNEFKVQDLFNLAVTFKMGGLTPDRLKKFSQVSLSAPALVMMDPEEILADASIDSYYIKYIDQGLTDIIFQLLAAEEGQTGAELKNKTVAELDLTLSVRGASVLKNPAALSAPLIAFLKNPQSLEISLKAEPPLSFASTKARAGNSSAILDSLNLTFSANGQPGSPLKFVEDKGRDDHGLDMDGHDRHAPEYGDDEDDEDDE